MFVSIVIDPEIIDQAIFYSNNMCYIGFRRVFEAVQQNGVILVDKQGHLIAMIRNRIQALETKYSQSLSIYFAELLKGKRKRIIKSNLNIEESKLKEDILKCVNELAIYCKVDAICVRPNVPNERFSFKGEIIQIEAYPDTSLERQRISFLTKVPPLHQLEFEEAKKLFDNAMRFSRWLRLYDRQLGKGNNTSSFRKGIEFLLSTWTENGHFSGEPGIRIEIVTGYKECIQTSDSPHEVARKQNANAEALRKVQRELIDRLCEKFPTYTFSLSVSRISPRDFHNRYLEGQYFILAIDTGFDLFDREGKFRGVTMTLREGDFDHLSQVRKDLYERFEFTATSTPSRIAR